MDSGTQPTSPDPYQTAAAQGAANREAAVSSSIVNNMDENTPYGSVNYQKIGDEYITDSNGNQVAVPRYQRNVVLSPTQAQINTNKEAMQIRAGNLGVYEADKITGLMSTPGPSASDLPYARGSNPADTAPSLSMPTAYTPMATTPGTDRPTLQTDTGQQQALQTDPGARPTFQTSVPGQQLQTNYGPSATLQTSLAPTPQMQTNFGSAPSLQTSVGNVPGLKTSVGPQDWTADRNAVEQAIYSRLDPQFQQDESALRTRLANQGLTPGSAAWNAEMDAFNRSKTDARMQAVLAGGQEQSRLAGLDLAQFQAGNQALQDQYGMNLSTMEAGNAAKAQQGTLGLQYGQAGNEAIAQQAGLDQSRMQAINQALGQQQTLNQSQIDAANAAKASQQGMDLSRMQAGNEAMGNQAALDLQRMQAGNEARTQQQGLDIATQTAKNQALSQQEGIDLARMQAGNAAVAGNNAAREQQTQDTNAALTTQYNLQSAAADYREQQRQAALQEALALRDQPLNEATALMYGGGGVSLPSFTAPYRQGVESAPVAQNVYQSYQDQLNAYNQQQQQNSSLMSGLFGLGGTALSGLFALSDRRAKTDIRRVGRTDGGLPVYTFRYKAGGPVQMGVMAQDVGKVDAAAVRTIGGLKHVDYARVN